MTTRQRIVQTYTARLSIAVRRHAEMNGIPVVAVNKYDVRRMLEDSMSSADSPYGVEIEEMETSSFVRLAREIVRNAESSNGVRRDAWAQAIRY